MMIHVSIFFRCIYIFLFSEFCISTFSSFGFSFGSFVPLVLSLCFRFLFVGVGSVGSSSIELFPILSICSTRVFYTIFHVSRMCCILFDCSTCVFYVVAFFHGRYPYCICFYMFYGEIWEYGKSIEKEKRNFFFFLSFYFPIFVFG